MEEKKGQRREFFRFKCAIPITFVELGEDGLPIDFASREGMIRDLSGGGMQMLTSHEMAVNTIVRMTLPMERDPLVILAIVLRVDENLNATHPYLYRARFAAMTQGDQDQLIRYMNIEQRRRRRR